MHLTKFHEYIKPRSQNPTFISSSVGTSLGSFYGTMNTRQNMENYSVPKKEDFYAQPYGTRANPEVPMSHSMKLQKPGSESSRYREINQGQIQDQEKDLAVRYNHSKSTQRMGDSRFSRLGTQSLVIPQISDKQVYERQAKNYNIISIRPKEVADTIKKFPKYRLQNQDVNFYRKVQIENEFRDRYFQQMKDKQARQWAQIKRLDDQRMQYQRPNSNGDQINNKYAGMKTDFIPKDLHVHQLHQ